MPFATRQGVRAKADVCYVIPYGKVTKDTPNGNLVSRCMSEDHGHGVEQI
jgi:hypothetical protein